MKKLLINVSLITALVLSLNASTIEPITNWSKYPIPQEVVSKSKGGLLADKVAIKDGVGSILIKSVNGNSFTLNNEEYNKLLLLNKDKLTDTIGIKELIANGDIIVDASILNAINGNTLSNPNGGSVYEDNKPCNDNNPLTINDKYLNNICLGTSIVGTSCDDNNIQTNDDKYDINGMCIGTLANNTCLGGFIGNPYTNTINCQGANITNEIFNKWVGLQSLQGILSLQVNLFSDLRGLINLTSVNGDIYLNANSSNFTSLNGIQNLKSVNGDIYINDNAYLTDISALSGITSLSGTIGIQSNVITKKIPSTAWLCQPAQANKFNNAYATKFQNDLCEVNLNLPPGTGPEASFSLILAESRFWDINQKNGLFDKIRTNGFTSSNMIYFHYSSDSWVTIQVNNSFRILRSGSSDHSTYNPPLIVERLSGTYENVTEIANSGISLRKIGSTEWDIMTNTLPAGKYRFGGVSNRIDSEWYIEKMD